MRSELYLRFPIEVGITRKKCSDMNELEKYTMTEIGDCFASVYNKNKGDAFIDKVFFDLDNESIPKVYIELIKLKNNLSTYGTTVHIYTGKKGFHCYLLLAPEYYPKEQAQEMLREVYSYFSQGIEFLDPRVTSDVNRLSRIPNTTRENGICCLLPQELPAMWFKLSGTVGRFNYPKYLINRKMTLGELYFMIRGKSYKYEGEVPGIKINLELQEEDIDTAKIVMKRILRPCVFRSIAHPEAGHEARTAAAIELNRAGLEASTATDLLASFDWSDFDYRMTLYHIKKLERERLKPYSCKKMKNFCIGKEDCWYIKLLNGEW